MEESARWALPMLFAGQAQKEMQHNEALTLIDALLHGRAESADMTAPPGAPGIGRCWIVAAGATGEWAGQGGAVALWTDGGWRFIAPRAGLRMDVADRDHALFHDGGEWRAVPVRGDGVYIDEKRVVGPRMGTIADPTGGVIIDGEVRSAVSAILVALRGHGLIAR